jgi:hypothetical protein
MLGRYQKCNLHMPGLGLFLDYGPDTVVGLSGMALEHAVPKVRGERVCYAYFMRNDVHVWVGAKANITDRIGAMQIASNTGCIVPLIKLSLF